MIELHKTADETNEGVTDMTSDRTLGSILAQNPYPKQIEDKKKELKKSSRIPHSGDKLGHEFRFRRMEELTDSAKSLEVQAVALIASCNGSVLKAKLEPQRLRKQNS